RTILDHPAYYPHNLRLFPELVCRAVVAIGQADGGVVVHCGVGRDRTGLISALLLTLAEAPQTVILDGYAAGVRGFNDSLVDYPVAHEPHRDETALENRLRPRLEALAAFLEATDVAEFLLAAGARPAELNAVRDKVR
ncbi:MAG: tyrosine-protein phosphatase, partial [Propionibacteriales bacterium]|nr:tyrosine-protein phosphatase [Propionibacteriales bacterium]